MSISEHKILSADLLNKQVTDAADRPTGTAQQIKYLFDRLALEVVIPALNALIDELTNSGASSVGTSVSGVAGTDVQTVLEGMKALIDDRYTKAQADGLLGDKVSKAEFASVLADMSIDENGVITVTRKNGTTKQLDTALEKIAINFDFDAETQKLKITLEDGTTKEVDLSAFVKPNEFVDSSCIDFITVYTDGTVTATIKAGGVTDEMLDSALKDALIAYRDAAAASAAAAKASEDNALTYKQAAETARTGAEKAQTEAEVSEINALVYAEGGTPTGHEGELVLQEVIPGAKGYMLMAQQYANNAATSASAADTRANGAVASAVEANSAKNDAAQSEKNAKAWAKGGTVTTKKVTSDGTIMYVSEDVTGASEYSSRAYAAYKNAAKYEQYAKAYAEGGTIEEEMVPSVNPLPDVLWPALDTPGAKGYVEQAKTAQETATAQAELASEAAGQAAESAETSRAAADRAENAAIHQPYPDASTGTWWFWDADAGAYVDSGIKAKADELHVASQDVLGGVQPVAQTDVMTIPVGVDQNGKLYADKDPEINALKRQLEALEGIVKEIQEKISEPVVDEITVSQINDMIVSYFENKTVSEVEA